MEDIVIVPVSDYEAICDDARRLRAKLAAETARADAAERQIAHVDRAIRETEARIVETLRATADGLPVEMRGSAGSFARAKMGALNEAADAIERGDHRKDGE